VWPSTFSLLALGDAKEEHWFPRVFIVTVHCSKVAIFWPIQRFRWLLGLQAEKFEMSSQKGRHEHEEEMGTGKVVVVAVKASRDISRNALVWALTHVVQPGDCIKLLVLIPPLSSSIDSFLSIFLHLLRQPVSYFIQFMSHLMAL